MRLFSIACIGLSLAVNAFVQTEASATSVTSSAAVLLIDAPPETYSPSGSNGSDTRTDPTSSEVQVSGNGPVTFASATAKTLFEQANIGIVSAISPFIKQSVNGNASPSSAVAQVAGAQATSTWTAQFSPSLFSLSTSQLPLAIDATQFPGSKILDWKDTFSVNNVQGSVNVQFNWTLSNANGNSVTGAFANLSCNSGGCSLGSHGNVNNFAPTGGAPGNYFIFLSLDLAHLDTPSMILSETVSFGGNTPNGTFSGDFIDPITLTLLNNGATVPDLVLYNSDLNGIIPLSGQDFAPTNATPLPATLPLFATGLGALGLLGWRRKRKAT